MKLWSITETKYDKAAKKVKPLLNLLPKGKRKHSRRVGKALHDAGVGKVGIYTGLLHDYLERGGSIYDLSDHINELGLPSTIIKAVQSLSRDEGMADSNSNQPLQHLQEILPGIGDESLKNIVILAKMADRLDNLHKRASGKILTKGYRRKSAELVNYLMSQYSGDPKPFKRLLKQLGKFGNIVKEAVDGPKVRSIQWSPAIIVIQFPSGDTWEYLIYENGWLETLMRKHRRNTGRLVAALRKWVVDGHITARKVTVNEEYEDLEDADEFSGAYEEACSVCGGIYTVLPEEPYFCEACERTVCPRCEVPPLKLSDDSYDDRIFCSRECRNNLMGGQTDNTNLS